MNKVEFSVEGLGDGIVEYTIELNVAGTRQTIQDKIANGEWKHYGPFDVKPGDAVYASIDGPMTFEAMLREQFRPMPGLTRAYAFNRNARKLVYVSLASSYISESRSDESGNLASTIDRYTRKDNYQYILELNGNGEIIGGEWAGGSHYDHPDFLWLPVRQNAASISGVSYEKVKDLLNRSVARRE